MCEGVDAVMLVWHTGSCEIGIPDGGLRLVSKTSGGLVKFSVAIEEDLVAILDRLAEERGLATKRSDVIRDALRLGAPEYRKQTTMLKNLHPEPVAV